MYVNRLSSEAISEVYVLDWVMLQSLLTDEQIASAPILILGNKIDLPGAASEDEIRHLFGLHSLTTGKVNSRPNFSVYLLLPPCVADADIIFLSCGFFFFFS